MRASGFGGSLKLALNRLEELVVDPTDPRSSNLNGGDGGGGGGGDIGILYSNLCQPNAQDRKNPKKQDPTVAPGQLMRALPRRRDHYPDDPCGTKRRDRCTKPCVHTCGK